jgi:hypothetical protein
VLETSAQEAVLKPGIALAELWDRSHAPLLRPAAAK